LLRTFFAKLAVTALSIIASAAVSTTAPSRASAEADEANVARGEQLFELCAQCHASNGGGNRLALAPAIAGLPDWYVAAQLKNFKAGIRGLNPRDTGGLRMYPMSQWLRRESDLQSVAAYVASLPKTLPEPELAHPGDPAKGEGYYAVCSACHGPDGRGNQGMGAPPLVDLSDWYLVESIQKYKAGIRGSGPGDALGAAMIGMAATLPDDQAIRDVVAYIETLRDR
jgi:cytochrome c553